MDFSPGTDATIQATTLENQCYSIIKSIQSFERSATYNPGNEVNMITSSSDDDTQVFSGNCEIYINHVLGIGGKSTYTIPTPYTNLPTWTEGTGGQGTATSWIEGLVERFLTLAFYERDDTYNITSVDPKITSVTWTLLDDFLSLPVVHNCILSCDFTFDFAVTDSSNGAATEAVAYLSGTYPGVS
ncbi:MAG: hypothetical protein AAGJ08_01830 [Cyanobacteria bacterium P01_H01_bin.35]